MEGVPPSWVAEAEGAVSSADDNFCEFRAKIGPSFPHLPGASGGSPPKPRRFPQGEGTPTRARGHIRRYEQPVNRRPSSPVCFWSGDLIYNQTAAVPEAVSADALKKGRLCGPLARATLLHILFRGTRERALQGRQGRERAVAEAGGQEREWSRWLHSLDD